MKRITKLCLSGMLILSLFSSAPATAQEYTFIDAAQLSWAASSIERLYKEGVIQGVNASEFAPHAPVTRAQLAVILGKLAKQPQVRNDFPFRDIHKSDWFYSSVKKMYGMGMIKGVSKTEFDPDGKVTREQAAVILARTFNYSYKGNYSLPYRDKNNISPWAINSVKAIAQKGHFSLFQRKFEPQKALTRAELAVILHKMLYGEPAPYVKPKLTSRSHELIEQRLSKAVSSVLGTPYVYGGSTTKGFDCSGFTRYVYKQLGVDLPRDSRSQFSVGESVSTDEMVKGDLIFFDTGGGEISHVGIYVGNNKIAHATSHGGAVKIEGLDWYFKNYRVVGVKRVI